MFNRFVLFLALVTSLCSCESVRSSAPVSPDVPAKPYFSQPTTPGGTPVSEVLLHASGPDTTFVVNVTLYAADLDKSSAPIRAEYRNNVVKMSQYLFLNPNTRTVTVALAIQSQRGRVGVDTVEYIYTLDESVRMRVPIRVEK